MLSAFADWRAAPGARHGVIARDSILADDRQEIGRGSAVILADPGRPALPGTSGKRRDRERL
jgi:hypothetical protein